MATRNKPLRRLAFGSCNQTFYAQPLWQPILQCEPDVWMWLGDSIYADSLKIETFKRLYAAQRAHPSYRQVRESIPIIGTWDDHDYGANNAGKEYPLKEQTQQAFLDFIDEPSDSPRRKQEGVYASYDYGPEGQRVKVVLLDTRYHREAPGPKSDLLGEVQWRWLEQQLSDPSADLIVLASSIAVIPQVYDFEEGWLHFPTAGGRLWALLIKAAAPVVLLSGDRHYAELSKLEHSALDWPLYELTSSGLTHCAFGFRDKNKYRVGQLYTAQNFGLLEFDWGIFNVTVRMRIRDAENVNRIKGEESFSLWRSRKPQTS